MDTSFLHSILWTLDALLFVVTVALYAAGGHDKFTVRRLKLRGRGR